MRPQNCISAPGEPGDCYRACLATITGIPIGTMPNFGADCRNEPERMWEEVRAFLAPHGLSIFSDYCTGEWPLEKVLEYFSDHNKGVPIILTVKPRFHDDPAHSVVALDGKIVHDPSGAGISGPSGDWWHFDVVAILPRAGDA